MCGSFRSAGPSVPAASRATITICLSGHRSRWEEPGEFRVFSGVQAQPQSPEAGRLYPLEGMNDARFGRRRLRR